MTVAPRCNDFLLTSPEEQELVRSDDKVQKLKFSVKDFATSEPFEIGKTGACFVRELDVTDDKSHRRPKREKRPEKYQQLQFGISISQALFPWNKTNLVTFVPRYLIVNKLKYPIIIRQVFISKGKKNYKSEIVAVGEECHVENEADVHASGEVMSNHKELHLEQVKGRQFGPESCSRI